MLVGESYLNELEAAAARLRDIESGRTKPTSQFKLIGSMRVADGVMIRSPTFVPNRMRFGREKLKSFGR